jgi:hypothetical protein
MEMVSRRSAFLPLHTRGLIPAKCHDWKKVEVKRYVTFDLEENCMRRRATQLSAKNGK